MTNATGHRRLAHFALATILVNLGVILWGAWVRASGSGAGCGNHWPLCNGQVLPHSPTTETMIELVHRTTSGLALLMVLALVIVTRRVLVPGHFARRAAMWSLLLIVMEALIGAGLVRFDLVADNASMARALTLGAHLVNTQFLLAALGATWWWSAGWSPVTLTALGPRGLWLLAGTVCLLVLGMTGVIASLGDTLFPARSLREGLAQDLDPTSHLLLRLRVLHPLLAVVTGLLVWMTATAAGRWRSDDPGVAHLARALGAVVLVQWGIGVSALLLMVPVALQLLHLLTADVLWLTWVAVMARSLARR